MSLRLRLLGAFAYGFLLILVALEVPLALNLASRVDAEVKNDAAGQAHIVAAQASGFMDDTPQLRSIARRAAADLGARVIIVDRDRAPARRFRGQQRPLVREPAGDQDSARRGAPIQGKRHSDTLGEDLLVHRRCR